MRVSWKHSRGSHAPSTHERAHLRRLADPWGTIIRAVRSRRSAAPGSARRGRTVLALAGTSVVVAGALGACGSLDARLEARQAADALKNAKVASFTLHLQDPAGELGKLGQGADMGTQLDVLERGAVRVTVDRAGDTTIGQTGSTTSGKDQQADPVAALKAAGAFEVAWTQSGKDVAALRLVDGVAYVRLDLAAFRAATGQDVPVDQLSGSDAPPQFATVVEGVKSGKWLSLDLAGLYQKADKAGLLDAEKQAQGLDPSAVDPAAVRSLAQDLLQAVRSASATSETVGKDQQVTVSVSVKAKQALLAALDVLGEPAYSSLLDADATLSTSLSSARSQIAALPDSPVTGSVLVEKGHVRRAALDLAGVVALGTDAQAKSTVKTAQLVVDVDDSAPSLAVPAADQVVQVDPLVDLALGSFAQLAGQAGIAD